MRQTIVSVTLEVKQESAGRLASLIDGLHDRAGSGGPMHGDYGWFMAAVPTVHFLSMNLFLGADYDPVFVLEANFDGAAGPFWKDLEAVIGVELRAMLRCCKRPLDSCGPLFDGVTRQHAAEPVAPYFAARSAVPSVFHQGNRGLTRDRIVAERTLFLAIRDEMATAHAGSDADASHGEAASPYRGIDPMAVHAGLRRALIAKFTWLGTLAPPRIPLGERLGDWLRLTLFAILAVLVLSLPGSVAALVAPTPRFLVLLAIACAMVWIPLYRLREPLGGVIKPWSFVKLLLKLLPAILAIALVYLVVAIPLTALGLALFTGETARIVVAGQAIRMAALGLLSAVVFSIPGILLWVRWLERRDSSHDAPPIDPELMRQMARREDRIPQNHMGSIVLVKPGMLRSIVVHAGHHALHLALRATATDGYLASMRTVHFAHWAFINNGGRLMFFSNFDQSWESYLDDFIEKAHVGLTLAWGCGVGFPPTRFLVNEGASYGTRFKNWARHSMVVSRFWYSAYPDLTVDQIERNNRIADGLRKPSLTPTEAAAWINDL